MISPCRDTLTSPSPALQPPSAPANVITLAWGARVSADFARYLFGICRDFGWGADHANWLMACMAFESGETFRADVLNKAGSGAVGLIQFMPATARGLGTTTESLALLSPASQLTYVRSYFRPYAHKIHTLADMYMAILLPKYIPAPGNAVLFSSGVAYRQNAGLDADNDGQVTKDEAAARVAAELARGLKLSNVAAYPWPAA
ncbi:MAG: lytic transglycosylase [Rhodanobacter sp.]